MKPGRITKRVIYWLRWRKVYGDWVLTQGASLYIPMQGRKNLSKKAAITVARFFCHNRWTTHGERCQLRICGLNGKVVKHGEHTYGQDPAKYPG